jgi:hypothetical protein
MNKGKIIDMLNSNDISDVKLGRAFLYQLKDNDISSIIEFLLLESKWKNYLGFDWVTMKFTIERYVSNEYIIIYFKKKR